MPPDWRCTPLQRVRRPVGEALTAIWSDRLPVSAADCWASMNFSLGAIQPSLSDDVRFALPGQERASEAHADVGRGLEGRMRGQLLIPFPRQGPTGLWEGLGNLRRERVPDDVGLIVR